MSVQQTNADEFDAWYFGIERGSTEPLPDTNGVEVCKRQAKESGRSVWCLADGWIYHPDGNKDANDLPDVED